MSFIQLKDGKRTTSIMKFSSIFTLDLIFAVCSGEEYSLLTKIASVSEADQEREVTFYAMLEKRVSKAAFFKYYFKKFDARRLF